MLSSTVIMAVLALVLLYLAYRQGDGAHLAGIRNGLLMVLQILPILILALIVASTAQILIPKEEMARWVGAEAGVKGIFFGTLVGFLTPGGPFVSMPLAAAFWRAGAGVGTMVAFLTSWACLGLSKMPLEVAILGWRLTVIRFLASLTLPFIAGLLAQAVFSRA